MAQDSNEHKIEPYVDDNSDDDFQPAIKFRKRRSRENSPHKEALKRLKGTSAGVSGSSFAGVSGSSSADVSGSSFAGVSGSSFAGVSGSSSLEKNETTKRVVTVKATVKSVWNPIYRRALYELVDATNTIVTHTFTFSKYIFLQELKKDLKFELDKYIRKDFFVEVFLSLIARKSQPGKLQDKTSNYRMIISQHKESYCKSANYTPISLLYAQQIALYECTKIQTAYFNNIKAHFGNRLRTILNKLCEKKKLAEDLSEELKKKKSSKEAISKILRKKVYDPCNQVKSAVEKKVMPETEILSDYTKAKIKAILQCYPDTYDFKKDSIYYDVKANPEFHYKAFMKISELFVSEKLHQFVCFPLRTTFIPCYMTLDSKIVNHHILKNKTELKTENKSQIWREVVNLNKKAFKDQDENKSLKFQGTIESDGIDDDTPNYIESLTPAELAKTQGKCVLIDPGRRDLLYMMKETSISKRNQVATYTKPTRTKLARHYRILNKKTKPASVQSSEENLSKTKSFTVNLEKYEEYIKARALAEKVLGPYYGNETRQTKQTYFHNRYFEFQVKNKADLYFGSLFVTRIRGYFPQPEREPNETTRLVIYAGYLELILQQKHLSVRLSQSDKTKLLRIITVLSRGEQEDLKQQASELLGQLQVLPFRKMKFSSKVFYDQDDLALVKKLKQKFGQDSILIVGNWSAPNVKYQEPIRNKGLLKMLQKNAFKVYLIDEFRTSSFCPVCEKSLEKFKTIRNPRPHKREKMPTVLCHGLLRCENLRCLNEHNDKRRLWNRDLVATLNFRKILTSLRNNGKRPVLFSR
ncbi:hypothetical protein CU097_014140 [Rhizopus azygosporus]|uniref:Uncharacterized protein n=1 Tax=Rhizopus azygosporus TaxID=86630 RepID=A0A367KCL6_RHIAZ|nr:hypothetical protein CU097_014140 [Rhizopus azygosporus]